MLFGEGAPVQDSIQTVSLQNRRDFLRNFLRNSGEQGRRRGEREARVACVGRFAKKSDFLANLPSHATRASRSPRACLAFAPVPLKYAKNHACSAG